MKPGYTVQPGDNPRTDILTSDGTRLYYKGRGKYGPDKNSNISIHIRDLQKSFGPLTIAPPEKETN
ncbi:hypothetical protein [Arcanobacterium buesumense]|uniref:Uncharacterized protein n=1 Tax=Arcanobacterium buesumense TaxID=2722751 RepID=A0A6H2ELS2_9ACTO|nr:hypothetical protein [Arcanobacterium buesumense]QJC22028.1 hypothetical protein HC352_05605 [Arcanobacterium buesumense]